MEIVIICLYVVLSYWAVGKTILSNKIRIGKLSDLFFTRLILGVVLGMVLIPAAVLKSIISK